MRRKFVQIVSFILALALLTPAALPSAESVGNLGDRVMRIGIYYGDAGKQSIDLTLVTGDGFNLGRYESDGAFTPLGTAAMSAITVRLDGDSSYGFVVEDAASGAELFRYDDRGLGTGLAVQPYSLTGEKTVTKCGYPYYGSFRFERFSQDTSRMTIVNHVGLDDYVKGVVPYEVSASWPMEALKAQAVCTRSYALTHVDTSHQKNWHFDLCDSTHCQVYKGVYTGAQADKVEEAVEATSGVTVRYNGEICQTVYSSCNGGASESNINVFGTDLPYLIGKADPYEAEMADSIPGYRWSVSYTGEELRSKLRSAGYANCALVTTVKTTLSGAGNVIALTFVDENGKSYSVYQDKCRTFLSLKSLHYTVSSDVEPAPEPTTEPTPTSAPTAGGSSGLMDTNGNALDFSQGVSVIDGSGNTSTATGGSILTGNGGTEIIGTSESSQSEEEAAPSGSASQTGSGVTGAIFTFRGAGWGHNVGLSQYGACAMANLGFSYDDILTFYYTGVTVE